MSAPVDKSLIQRLVRDTIQQLPPRPVKAATIGTITVNELRGKPTAPTPDAGDSSQRVATTDFVQSVVSKVPGTALYYVENTSPVSITGTALGSSNLVVGGDAIDYDGSPVWVEFGAPIVELPAVAGGYMNIILFDSGTAIANMGEPLNGVAHTAWIPVTLRRKITPSAGTHHYSIKAWVSSTTGAPAIYGGTGTGGDYSPSYINITRA